MSKWRFARTTVPCLLSGIVLAIALSPPAEATLSSFSNVTGAVGAVITETPPNPVVKDPNDGILLAFPLAWGLLAYRPRSRLLPGVTIGLTAIFLVPGPVILHVAAGKGYISRSVAASWWWQGLIVPHQAWCILAFSVVLTAALLIARGEMRVELPAMQAESVGNRPDTT